MIRIQMTDAETARWLMRAVVVVNPSCYFVPFVVNYLA